MPRLNGQSFGECDRRIVTGNFSQIAGQYPAATFENYEELKEWLWNDYYLKTTKPSERVRKLVNVRNLTFSEFKRKRLRFYPT